MVDTCGINDRYYDAQVKELGKKRKYIKRIVDDLVGRGKSGEDQLCRIAIELSKLGGSVCKSDSLDPKQAEEELANLRLHLGRENIRLKDLDEGVKQTTKRITPAERISRLSQVKSKFRELHGGWIGTPQARGYAFQELMQELFEAHEIPYTPSFRTTGQELDGMFSYEGRRFLLEARWRKIEADFQALSHFHAKITTKFHGTVGVFVSMEGFSADAIESLTRLGESRFLLLPGMEFMKIIEEVISLPDALTQMLDKAHQHGVIQVNLDL